MSKTSFWFFVGLAWCMTGPAAAQEVSGQGQVWKIVRDGLKLEIQALALDQVLGFAIGRGFSSRDANFAARTGCIFRSNIGNAAPGAEQPAITLDLTKWRITVSGTEQAMMTRERWDRIWAMRKAPEAPKIAFHWALFPTHQSHAPGDYNWGFLSMGMPPGTLFDLDIHWRHGGKSFSHSFKGLKCGT